MPREAASFTSSGNSFPLSVMKVTWSVRRQWLIFCCETWSRMVAKSWIFFRICGKEVPIMIFCCVQGLDPLKEILTSEATGVMSSAHFFAPNRGKVPLVVRLSLTLYFLQISRIFSKSLYRSGSPIVEGIISLSPYGAASLTTDSIHWKGIMRCGVLFCSRCFRFGL